MKFCGVIKRFGPGLSWFTIALLLFAGGAGATETNSIRLAIGPFFVPEGVTQIQNEMAIFPDLLTAKLSEQNHFQLVERQKVSEIWSELNMAANRMDSRHTLLNLGRVLACDEFVSGTVVATGTNTQIWTTVIDTRNGKVTGLRLLPFNITNSEATINGIVSFLDEIRSGKAPQHFVGLGRFLDMSISSTHEDWSDRLRMMVEKYFSDAGYGVVDDETISPIFEEFQFEQAGFSESQTNRVKLQPSFWFVDGLCKWVRDTDNRLSVAIRIRKPGGDEQIFHFRTSPGGELESNVFAIIHRNLQTITNRFIQERSIEEEAKLHEQELQDASVLKTLMPLIGYSTNDQESVIDQHIKQSRRERVMEAERMLLLDPNNLEAKAFVAFGYCGDGDLALRERGIQMLEELSTCTNSTVAFAAYHALAYGMRIMNRTGREEILMKPVKSPDPEVEKTFAEIKYNREQQRRRDQIRSAQSLLHLNPDDSAAKLSLAIGYFQDPSDAAMRARGRQMLMDLSAMATIFVTKPFIHAGFVKRDKEKVKF